MRTTLLKTIQNCYKKALKEKIDQDPTLFDSLQNDAALLSRRNAIRSLGLGATGLIIGSKSILGDHGIISSLTQDNSNPVIAILGGGVAGLHAAWTLQNKGIHAKVYEASSRAGGRMFTLHNRFRQGLNTEAGGEFLDSDHEDMLGLAKHFNLPLLDVTMDKSANEEIIFHYDNVNYSQEEAAKAFEPIVKTLMDDRIKCGEDYDTPFAESLDNTSMDEYIMKLKCDKWLKELLLAAYIGEYGLEASDQSSLNFISFIGFPKDGKLPLFGESDERYKVIGGNQQIIYKLAEALGDKIKFQMQVKAITKKGRQYIIDFNQGEPVKADIIICAIPFTILRNIELKIPNIDPVKMKCIKELGYGQNNKLLLGMKERVWRFGARPMLGYTYDKMVHTGWDNSHMQNENMGPAGYTVFLGGNDSLALASKTKDENGKRKLDQGVLNQYLDRMDKIYGGFKSHFNNDHEVITWSGNPLTKGSYAAYKVGQWSTIAGLEAAPLSDTFLFAGEHCSSNFQGFMNGAAETGRVAAETVLAKMKK